jgi:hypothetical protein
MTGFSVLLQKKSAESLDIIKAASHTLAVFTEISVFLDEDLSLIGLPISYPLLTWATMIG